MLEGGAIKSFLRLAAAALHVVGFASTSKADLNGPTNPPSDDPPLIIGGGWQTFRWSSGVGSLNDEGAFIFTTLAPVTIKVTDAYLVGDQVRLYNNYPSTVLGDTSVPAGGYSFTGDPDAAYSDPNYSHGAFTVGPGTYAITIETIAIAPDFPVGGAFIRGDLAPSATPDPAPWPSPVSPT